MNFGQTRPMAVYNRQIRYLDYMENGVRTRGAGFVKLERRDDLCNISLQISGLYRKDRFTRPLLLMDKQGQHELCKLQLADGGIKLYLENLNCYDLDGQGLNYEMLQGLRIPISEGKEICCLWSEEVREWIPPQLGENALAMDATPEPESILDAESEMEAEMKSEMKPVEESVAEYTAESAEESVEKSEVKSEPTPMVLKEDKWEQLWTIYPHKSPFSDDREYLALGPGDFVILSSKHYKLANNSFLLHGYYNYKHLILTRIRERNQMRYYIGVPGNFYEREKRTAVMFGFESFECAIEPAGEGDFGYYMMPVEL